MAENNNAVIISLVAQTHIHAGIGQSTGALDLPVARERTTHYPFIPGSGVKGAFKVWAENHDKIKNSVNSLFGEEGQADKDSGGSEGAGNLLCSDARLLLLPVRCMSDAFKWVTCPAILSRFKRDCVRANVAITLPNISVEKGKYAGVNTADEWLGLEEREFEAAPDSNLDQVVSALKEVVAEDNLKNRLVVLSDKDFTWFARYALPVMARNKLDDNKSSDNLWYEESLAPDTIMYALFGQRNRGAVAKIKTAIEAEKYIQIGGNETIGQGWFEMKILSGGNQ